MSSWGGGAPRVRRTREADHCEDENGDANGDVEERRGALLDGLAVHAVVEGVLDAVVDEELEDDEGGDRPVEDDLEQRVAGGARPSWDSRQRPHRHVVADRRFHEVVAAGHDADILLAVDLVDEGVGLAAGRQLRRSTASRRSRCRWRGTGRRSPRR